MKLDSFSDEDLYQLGRYVREQQLARAKGTALQKKEFAEWIRLNAISLLDKVEDAWRWIRKQLDLLE
jgi:hypothetical protein